ncbi:MAG: ABC transporter ATP-binding protein [Rhodospirillaceae bacterium]|jgi:ABC-2 type transport system ATP-binding protein|nr:ABC transporter ATP-binding protein [Rhodospirillaceae bacterium]
METMVELDNLSKHFGPFVAVDGISLKVRKGEVLGFLGPNGAGKSTTMRMVAGFLTATSGTAKVCGHDVEAEPVLVKSLIGYMAEGSPSYEDMTVRAFLKFIAEVRGLSGRPAAVRIEEVVSKIKLEAVIDRSIEVLSKGYKRRVGMAQAILHDPPVLILDEPTDGLDPNQKHHVRTLIEEMASEKAIIVSTHILEEVEAVCTRAVVIGNGKLLADGTSEDLLSILPEHDAIHVVVKPVTVDLAVSKLQTVPGVSRVTLTQRADGASQIACMPREGAEIIDGINSVLRDDGISYSEVYKHRGDLDAVFRKITGGGSNNA